MRCLTAALSMVSLLGSLPGSMLLAQTPQAPMAHHGLRLPDAFFAGNRAALLAKAKAMGPGTLVVAKSMPTQPSSGDGEHPYRQDSDFYYLTGVEEEHAVALLDADKGTYTLLVQARDPRRETYTGTRLGVAGAKAKGADEAVEYPAAEKTLNEALQRAKRVVFINNFDDAFRLKVLDAVYPKGTVGWKVDYEKILVDGRPIVGEMRVIKQPMEVQMIQRAVDASIEGHLAAMRGSATFTNEGQVAAALEGTVRALGARFLSYQTIAGAGGNGCVLHYPFNDQPITPGSLILMDASGEIGFYTSDITRTWPANGTFTGEQRALYDIVLKAQEAGIQELRPGRPHGASMRAAARVISDGLVDLGLIQGDKEEAFKRGDWNKFLPHGVSHYLGLDVHDAGSYGPADTFHRHAGTRALAAGMVLTMEPGIYIPKGMEGVAAKWQGIGIRIEDVILVTANEPCNLSARLPRRAEDLEALVRGGAKRLK
ncbi:aminopeptidase P family protein [Geothrix sp. PMB-07]|uniref:aminopeptidase P family protein n=1 Tax=Geothrix sp. PMB-07 TaxID=3068640 RepID=UPI0027413F18|nr:aminopeptidase P family protein [Geothrix sp. PMB-07]WLT32525.1 aminopeptidase P family protein [Geothrix sp. PMB-07]